MGRGGQRHEFPVLLQHIPGATSSGLRCDPGNRVNMLFLNRWCDRLQTLDRGVSPLSMSSEVTMSCAHTHSPCCCFQWQRRFWYATSKKEHKVLVLSNTKLLLCLSQLELANMLKTGQLREMWVVASQTHLQFNMVRIATTVSRSCMSVIVR